MTRFVIGISLFVVACGSGDGDMPGSACHEPMGGHRDFSLVVEDGSVMWRGLGEAMHKYEGTTTVGVAVDALELRATDGTVASFSGMRPQLDKGAVVWASLDQLSRKPNPYAFYQTRANLLRVSEHGPVLAEDLIGEAPHGIPGDIPFLGVNATIAAGCTDDTSCYTNHRFEVTIHGDTDVLIPEGTHDRVMIGGVAYAIEVDSAGSLDYIDPSGTCGAADWTHQPALSLAGHAVDYDVVLERTGS